MISTISKKYNQKKIIRSITNSDYLAPSKPLFSLTRILPVRDAYSFNLGIHMFNLKSNGLIIHPEHQYNTRSSSDAYVQFQRLSTCQKSLQFSGPKCWNSIPVQIKNSCSIEVFKRKYKKYLLSHYDCD